MALDPELQAYLARVARRIRVARFGRLALRTWWVVAVAGLSLGALRLADGLPPLSVEIVGIALGAWFLIVAAGLVSGAVSTAEAARKVDSATDGADRLVTVLGVGELGEWGAVISADAREFARRNPPGRIAPLRWRAGAGWALVPILVAVGLAGVFQVNANRTSAERIAAAEILDEAAEVVAVPDSPALAEAEAALRDSADGLREQLASSPREDALRALAKAAAEVDRLRAESGSDGASGSGGPSDDSAEGVPPVIAGMATSEASAVGDGRRLSEEELAEMASRLEEMKRAARGEPESGGDGSGEGGGDQGGEALAQLEAAAEAGREGASAGESASGRPGGGPGSDRDVGAGGPLMGAKEEGGATGADDQSGRDNGAGAAVAVGTISADGGGRAERAYREAYTKAAREAENTVTREEVPTGSRELVRRYFERIAPGE